MMRTAIPQKQGLYDPQFEHDACGIGFVANIKGTASHEIVEQALQILLNLDHRGGQGEENTGDGAGILMQLPHSFLVEECAKIGISLPEFGSYGVGMMFLPQDPTHRAICEHTLEAIIKDEGQILLGWRTLPTADAGLGASAKSVEPFMRQVFIGANPALKDQLAFERKLYVIRKLAEQQIRFGNIAGGKQFFFTSLSSRTIVYKGMLTPEQVDKYYVDLKNPKLKTALALVHSRFSTNTFPSWERAHPYRYIIHNGEFNTLRGNVNWMHARQAVLSSDLFGDDIKRILPIIDNDGSDSQIFDNCLEFLTLAGYSLPHAAMMMIPEPWVKHESMDDKKRAFYEYHSCLMEPWDGPAAVAFTDGSIIGAVLDRNGLRPARYYVTKNDLIIMASEVGVLTIKPEDILCKKRLQPGRMLLVDTVSGRIIDDEELKQQIATEKPYQDWLDTHLINLEDLPAASAMPKLNQEEVLNSQLAFGYTYEDIRKTIVPMAINGIDPIGAMGTDTPLAVLSEKSQLLYSYFKQLFAQVTNPPIDAIREEIITASDLTIGAERNLICPVPESCHRIRIKSPILTNEQLAKIVNIKEAGYKSVTLSVLYDVTAGANNHEQSLEYALSHALEQLYEAVDTAIAAGATFIILSDRGVNKKQVAIPMLLAAAGVHHHLIRNGTRTKVSLITETGEAREVHHFALLIGYGVSAINPYLAYETLTSMIDTSLIENITYDKAVSNYVKAATKGVVKVLSKMGISTIQSYHGAQIFECVGIAQDVIDKYFTRTPSRIGGIGLDVIAEEVAARHKRAFDYIDGRNRTLDSGSDHQWRKDGEYHLYNPESITMLQAACRNNSYQQFLAYTEQLNDETQKQATLRGLFDLKFADNPVPIEEVESVESICKRFKTGAMSFGSISQEAHEALAIAMNRIGGKSNTGEGGEHPSRFVPDANGDLRRSAIKQVASGRFGVTSNYLVNADEIQIKMAQGAKPGEGGQLPGRKVYPWVAEVRGTTAGVGLISPPPHHDIYSIEDLAELIHDLKNANPRARINVKLVSEVGVGTIAAGVAKGRADVVLISGYDGGTGASPRTSIKHAGLPWELGLAETHQTLLLNNLRDRIVVETDGKLLTGRDVVIAALLGAEEYGFATAPLVVLGCVMMRVCNLDTCPVGVATQNPELRKRFNGDPAHVVNFMKFIAMNMREYMSKLGFRTIDEMIGRTDKLDVTRAANHRKAKHLDYSAILYQPAVSSLVGRYCSKQQDHGLAKSLDMTKLLDICKPAIDNKTLVQANLDICNINRVVGTITGSEITRKYGSVGLPEDTIRLNFSGSAGQSFGAFIPKGMTMTLEGDANDYVGKGLSGGKLIVYPPRNSTFVPEENILIGNVAFYGATSGEAYIRGIAGERFCVRNSGANVVVEGVGDHGCEYMTGGRVVILGSTGRNFAAGMSGGVAYVLDVNGNFRDLCNMEMVELAQLVDEQFVDGQLDYKNFENNQNITELRKMIEAHATLTGSTYAKSILDNWKHMLPKFIMVIPTDYKRMLEALGRANKTGLTGSDAVMAAFKENKNDQSRISGN